MRSLINFALNVFAIAVALWAVVAVIPGITITPAETGNFIAVAIVFIIINAVVMPVLRVLGAPLTCLTLGLFSLVINGAALIIRSGRSPLTWGSATSSSTPGAPRSSAPSCCPSSAASSTSLLARCGSAISRPQTAAGRPPGDASQWGIHGGVPGAVDKKATASQDLFQAHAGLGGAGMLPAQLCHQITQGGRGFYLIRSHARGGAGSGEIVNGQHALHYAPHARAMSRPRVN